MYHASDLSDGRSTYELDDGTVVILVQGPGTGDGYVRVRCRVTPTSEEIKDIADKFNEKYPDDCKDEPRIERERPWEYRPPRVIGNARKAHKRPMRRFPTRYT